MFSVGDSSGLQAGQFNTLTILLQLCCYNTCRVWFGMIHLKQRRTSPKKTPRWHMMIQNLSIIPWQHKQHTTLHSKRQLYNTSNSKSGPIWNTLMSLKHFTYIWNLNQVIWLDNCNILSSFSHFAVFQTNNLKLQTAIDCLILTSLSFAAGQTTLAAKM